MAKRKSNINIGTILTIGFVLLIAGFMTGVVPLGSMIFDKNGDGVVDKDDLKYCVQNKLDCDYQSMITYIRGGTALGGSAGSCTQSELASMDANKDCIVQDFELLNAIDYWSAGTISDFCLLSGIDSWAGMGIDDCVPQGGVTTTSTVPSTSTVPPTSTTTIPPCVGDTCGGTPWGIILIILAVVVLAGLYLRGR